MIGLGDLFEEALRLVIGADNLGIAVAHGPVDDPGADRVHASNVAKVDGQRVGLGGDLAGRARGARDRDRPRHAVGRAVPFSPLWRITVHLWTRVREILRCSKLLRCAPLSRQEKRP